VFQVRVREIIRERVWGKLISNIAVEDILLFLQKRLLHLEHTASILGLVCGPFKRDALLKNAQQYFRKMT
jgi:hypothetical protein